MKFSSVTLLLAAIAGISAANPLRGTEDRRLGSSSSSDDCDDEEKNVWKDDCAYEEETFKLYRPNNGVDVDTFTVDCGNNGNNKPMYYIFGTDEESCKDDKICSCKKKDGKVSCDVQVSEKNSDCQYNYVYINAHVLCC